MLRLRCEDRRNHFAVAPRADGVGGDTGGQRRSAAAPGCIVLAQRAQEGPGTFPAITRDVPIPYSRIYGLVRPVLLLVRSGWGRDQRLDGGDMQQRTDAEFCRHAVIRLIDPNQDVASCQQGHFRMANLIGQPARHDKPKGTEGPLRQKFSESLDRHTQHYTLAPTDWRLPCHRRMYTWGFLNWPG